MKKINTGILKSILMLGVIGLFISSSVFATDIQSSAIAQGLTRLLADAINWLLITIVAVCVLVIAYNSVRAMVADEHDKEKFKKRIPGALIFLVIGLVAGGLAQIAVNYFGS
jgi:uncharacterized BrkB/YihY/UPF0761 family membrane protein